MNPLTQSKNTTILPLLIALTLGFFGLSPQAHAVCQEGCLTSFNTVLGDDALLSLTTGAGNTAIGSDALFSNTSGNLNTAVGASLQKVSAQLEVNKFATGRIRRGGPAPQIVLNNQ